MTLINPEEIEDQSIVCIAELNTESLREYASNLETPTKTGTYINTNKNTEVAVGENKVDITTSNNSNTALIAGKFEYPSWRFLNSGKICYSVNTEDFVKAINKLGNETAYIIATENGLELSNNTDLDKQPRIEMESHTLNGNSHDPWGVYEDKSPFTAEVKRGDLVQTLKVIYQLYGGGTTVTFSYNQETEKIDIEAEDVSVSITPEDSPKNPEKGMETEYHSDVLEEATDSMDMEGTATVKFTDDMPFEITTPSDQQNGDKTSNQTVTRAIAPRITDED